MPAMSPTMTEGNIASWKIHEGEKYSTGDVLLEIETDKATMDVEAQEDGQLAKIIQQSGAKGVKVGSRIAVIAEEGDDLSTLELPADETSKPASPPKDEGKPASKAPEKPAQKPQTTSARKPQTYPLYPSVAQLLKEKGLSPSDADRIPASGPKGRLLKGDVLSYVGKIQSSYSSEQSARIAKLGHLDLSNIQPAPPKTATAPMEEKVEKQPATKELEIPIQTEITIPISLSPAIEVQKRVKESLGINLPLSTLIARATELANEDLPSSANRRPTADELFNDVLGLDKVPANRTSRGRFIPQIGPFQPPPALAPSTRSGTPSTDIYDILAGNQRKSLPSMPSSFKGPLSPSTSVFSVVAAKGDEKRARVFLERIKTLLQVDAGSLVL